MEGTDGDGAEKEENLFCAIKHSMNSEHSSILSWKLGEKRMHPRALGSAAHPRGKIFFWGIMHVCKHSSMKQPAAAAGNIIKKGNKDGNSTTLINFSLF